ncbi:MAG: hypothetical protein ACJ789_02720 [Thermomicrobiales bacterium]
MNAPGTIDITATGQTFGEALTNALLQVIAYAGSSLPEAEASIAIPIRARESDSTALTRAMVSQILAELEQGAQIATVRIDGLLKRDGDFVCWGYAFAAPEPSTSPKHAYAVRDLTIRDATSGTEILVTLAQESG